MGGRCTPPTRGRGQTGTNGGGGGQAERAGPAGSRKSSPPPPWSRPFTRTAAAAKPQPAERCRTVRGSSSRAVAAEPRWRKGRSSAWLTAEKASAGGDGPRVRAAIAVRKSGASTGPAGQRAPPRRRRASSICRADLPPYSSLAWRTTSLRNASGSAGKKTPSGLTVEIVCTRGAERRSVLAVWDVIWTPSRRPLCSRRERHAASAALLPHQAAADASSATARHGRGGGAEEGGAEGPESGKG